MGVVADCDAFEARIIAQFRDRDGRLVRSVRLGEFDSPGESGWEDVQRAALILDQAASYLYNSANSAVPPRAFFEMLGQLCEFVVGAMASDIDDA